MAGCWCLVLLLQQAAAAWAPAEAGRKVGPAAVDDLAFIQRDLLPMKRDRDRPASAYRVISPGLNWLREFILSMPAPGRAMVDFVSSMEATLGVARGGILDGFLNKLWASLHTTPGGPIYGGELGNASLVNLSGWRQTTFTTFATKSLYALRKEVLQNNVTLAEFIQTNANLSKWAESYGQALQKRCEGLRHALEKAKRKEVIPLTVDFLSSEFRAVKPVLRSQLKNVTRFMRQLDWGRDGQWVKMSLPMLEMSLAAAGNMFDPIVADLSDLTPVGFCRTMSPLLLNTSSVHAFFKQWQSTMGQWEKDVSKLQYSPMMVTAPLEVPKLARFMRQFVSTGVTVLRVGTDSAQLVNDTVWYAMSQRLHCHEIAAAHRRGLGLLATAVLLAGAWSQLP